VGKVQPLNGHGWLLSFATNRSEQAMTLQQTEHIHVCALRHIPEMVKQTGARHLVSAINADCLPVTPAGISRDRHLKLDMHDITELQPGTTLPSTEHVLELLDFVQSWDRQAPILIHCFAGLSRSTAAAFITLCALNPRAPEVAIAQALRRSSDTAIPNRLFVMLADKVLHREGHMVAALDSMGQNRIANECIPFGIEALHGPNETATSACPLISCSAPRTSRARRMVIKKSGLRRIRKAP
jgi:predicted protein tyrosine phosphatase